MDIELTIRAIEEWLGAPLPAFYRAFLSKGEARMCGPQVVFYGAADVIERNNTYETKIYCPGFITIGDDSGGRAVVIPVSGARAVYLVDHGYMDPDGFELQSEDLEEWMSHECQSNNAPNAGASSGAKRLAPFRYRCACR